MGQKGLITRGELEERFEEETWDSTVMVVIFTVMIFMALLPFVQQATVMAQEATAMAVSPRVPVLTQALEPIAANVGAMWYKITPLGQPNELRMIGENSTGAFEEILISLST